MGHTFTEMAMVKFVAVVCLACCAGVAWAADPAAPDSYIIDFNTDIKGATLVSMAINRSMAPLGADHLHALVKDGARHPAAPKKQQLTCVHRILRWCCLLPRRTRLRGSVRYRWHARNE